MRKTIEKLESALDQLTAANALPVTDTSRALMVFNAGQLVAEVNSLLNGVRLNDVLARLESAASAIERQTNAEKELGIIQRGIQEATLPERLAENVRKAVREEGRMKRPHLFTGRRDEFLHIGHEHHYGSVCGAMIAKEAVGFDLVGSVCPACKTFWDTMPALNS